MNRSDLRHEESKAVYDDMVVGFAMLWTEREALKEENSKLRRELRVIKDLFGGSEHRNTRL